MTEQSRDQGTGFTPMSNLRLIAESATLLASIAVVGGFLLVGIAMTGMNWFYGHFDLTAEDVGLDQSRILLQTGGTAVLVVSSSIVFGVAFAFLSMFRDASRRSSKRWIFLRPNVLRDRRMVRRSLVASMVCLVAYFAWGVAAANTSLADIRAGRSTGHQILAHGQIVARCEHLWWTDRGLDSVFESVPGESFVFLGSASSIAVFYNPRTRHTIRVSASEVSSRGC